LAGTLTFKSAGGYDISVSATDGRGGKGTATFHMMVQNTDRPPALKTPPSQSDRVGRTVSLQLHAPDPDGDTVTFDASGLPPGLAIDQASGLITGTTTTSGLFTVSVSASDGEATATTSFDWT